RLEFADDLKWPRLLCHNQSLGEFWMRFPSASRVTRITISQSRNTSSCITSSPCEGGTKMVSLIPWARRRDFGDAGSLLDLRSEMDRLFDRFFESSVGWGDTSLGMPAV